MSNPMKPRDERITINREFSSVDEFIREYVSNLSRSGVFIRSDNPLPIGTKVNLHFTILLEEIETVDGVGEVVRVSENPSGMGVVFTNLDSISKNLIARVMTRASSVQLDEDDDE